MDYLYPLEIATFFNVDPLQDFEDTYLIEHGSGMDGANFEEGKSNGDSNGQDVSMISLVVLVCLFVCFMFCVLCFFFFFFFLGGGGCWLGARASLKPLFSEERTQSILSY